MVARGLSARRSCQLLGIGRSSCAYERVPSRNADLTARLREIASEHPRMGCRLAWSMLRKEFAPLNLKRVRRIWRKEGLSARPKRRRRLPPGPKPELAAARPNHVWCMDFAHDQCFNGVRIKCLAVLDEACRE